MALPTVAQFSPKDTTHDKQIWVLEVAVISLQACFTFLCFYTIACYITFAVVFTAPSPPPEKHLCLKDANPDIYSNLFIIPQK